MFVKTTRRKRGDKTYTYLSLVEAVRVNGRGTHRTLLRLGEVSELRDTGQLDRIIAALSNHAEGTWLQADELAATEHQGSGRSPPSTTCIGVSVSTNTSKPSATGEPRPVSPTRCS